MEISHSAINSHVGHIDIFEIINSKGCSLELSSLGAGILAINVPDKNGKIENVVLRYANPADYFMDGPCMGKIPGRFANRIANGAFAIQDKVYHLNKNDGKNSLHGGHFGFHNKIWKYEILSDGLRFNYFSKDGEEGYPGNLRVSVEYKWTENNELMLTLTAETDHATIVNLTNHAYFNLDGADSGSVLNHKLCIKASNYLPTDSEFIPTGDVVSVKGTPMDFREQTTFKWETGLNFPQLKIGKGYNHYYVFDNWYPGKIINEAVILKSDNSGRILSISTSQPGVQIYTGNWLDGSPLNISGKSYKDYNGVAIELQGYPDAPNHKNFPSPILLPEEKYHQIIKYSFLTTEK